MTFTFVELYDDDCDIFGHKVSKRDLIFIRLLPFLLIGGACIFFYFLFFFKFF